MLEREWNTENRWQPDPTLRLSQLNHPTISKDHPAFSQLPAKERGLVTALYRQYERWSHKLYFKHGLSGRLIAALNGYRFTAKLADCMMVSNPYAKHQHYGRCFLDWLCGFCAYLKGQDLLKKYAGAWEAEAWYEMVLSLKVGVCPTCPTHDTMRDVLDAMVAWLEIKVHQFYPHLIVTPHIHVLLRCECPPDLRVLNILVAAEWIGRQLESVPDLFIAPVRSEAHFHELLTYIKPIDTYAPYDSGYRAARAAGRLDVFHQEVREFFEALTVETTEYQGVTFKEAVRSALKQTLPKKLWESAQKQWDELLAEIVTKPVTEPLSKVLTEAIKKTLKKKELSEALTNAITDAAYMVKQRRKVMLVTRRRFLYGGDCHGSSANPLGLNKAVRSTKAHQDAIRAKVETAREAEECSREADEHQPGE
jgi:hypothetical protein